MRARENPFSTDRVLTARFRLQDDTTWGDLLRRLAGLGYRAAIVGPDGSGKTTLLEDLKPRLRARRFSVRRLSLNRWRRRLPRRVARQFFRSLAPRDVILFDGADELSWAAWLWFRWRTRHAAGLIITAHQPGRLPTLLHCSTSPRLLDRIVEEIAPQEAARLRSLTPGLFRKHKGNLRDALRELYDLYA